MNNLDQLTQLAIKYKTDKWGKHNYTPFYFKLFDGHQENVKKLLEIGVAEGAGVRMFRDFFPNATIYGAENEKKRVFKEDRIKVYHCDQSSKADIERLISKTGDDLQIIIDDGSHNPEHQIFTCLEIMGRLKGDPLYIIEDVADDKVFHNLKMFFDCGMERVGKRYDDRLVIVRRKRVKG